MRKYTKGHKCTVTNISLNSALACSRRWRKEMCAEKTVRGGVGGSAFALRGHCTPLSENLEQVNSASIYTFGKIIEPFWNNCSEKFEVIYQA